MEPNEKAIITARSTPASTPPEAFRPPAREVVLEPPHPSPPEPPAAETVTEGAAPAKPTEGAASGKAAAAAKQKNNVRKIRIERMMSKAELARRANLSVLTIDRIEKGFGCRMDTKRKILEALGLSLDDRVRVFGEEE
jgi:DNA-binding XRE family transcriptional regulator